MIKSTELINANICYIVIISYFMAENFVNSFDHLNKSSIESFNLVFLVVNIINVVVIVIFIIIVIVDLDIAIQEQAFYLQLFFHNYL